LIINNNRLGVLKEVKRFLETYEANPKQKGLYVHGKCGQGKSYIIAYLALELANKGIDVAFVYYPDLVRTIKSMVTTGGINELVNELKRVPILILDDFGGESNTNFIRDEVLLPILQYRMVNKKPLFITSNLDRNAIIDHLSESTKEIDYQKAVRVFERIKTLVDFIELNDQNYR
jgi:primosomal protein DnaI